VKILDKNFGKGKGFSNEPKHRKLFHHPSKSRKYFLDIAVR
jgi:hypothetical protein